MSNVINHPLRASRVETARRCLFADITKAGLEDIVSRLDDNSWRRVMNTAILLELARPGGRTEGNHDQPEQAPRDLTRE